MATRGRPRKIQPTAETISEEQFARDIHEHGHGKLTVSAPVQPPPPSPAVLALQASIVEMVNQRAELRRSANSAQSELYVAQAKVQAATGELQALEQEVQYRMGVIAQLENRTPQVQQITGTPWTSGNVSMPTFGAVSISSEPTIQASPYAGDPNDLVNKGHATRAML